MPRDARVALQSVRPPDQEGHAPRAQPVDRVLVEGEGRRVGRPDGSRDVLAPDDPPVPIPSAKRAAGGVSGPLNGQAYAVVHDVSPGQSECRGVRMGQRFPGATAFPIPTRCHRSDRSARASSGTTECELSPRLPRTANGAAWGQAALRLHPGRRRRSRRFTVARRDPGDPAWREALNRTSGTMVRSR